MRVLVDEPNNRAMAILPDDQVSLAIGRGGQNRRLTSRLTGVEIEIMKESEYRKMIEEERGKEVPLEYVEGLSQSMIGKLQDAGLQTVRDILKVGEEGLVQVKGIGEKTAVKIWALVQAREQAGAAGTEVAEEAQDTEVEEEEVQEVETAEEEEEEAQEVEAAEEEEEAQEPEVATDDGLEESTDATTSEAPEENAVPESETDETEKMPQA
jgi:N utilization substance protein A